MESLELVLSSNLSSRFGLSTESQIEFKVDELYAAAITGNDRYGDIQNQELQVRECYKHCLDYALFNEKWSDKLPKFEDIIFMVSEINMDNMVEAYAIRILNDPDEIADIKHYLNEDFSEDDLLQAIDEQAYEYASGELHNWGYYFGHDYLERFVLSVIIEHKLPVDVTDTIALGNSGRSIACDVILCDAQVILFPDLMSQSFAQADVFYHHGMESEPFVSENLIAFPRPSEDICLIPEFAGHRVRGLF